jgi:hypothetical protein
MEIDSIAPNLELGTRLRLVFSFTPQPFYLLGMSRRYTLAIRLGGTQNWSGHYGDEKNLVHVPIIELRLSSP